MRAPVANRSRRRRALLKLNQRTTLKTDIRSPSDENERKTTGAA
jgi:hypothetical protein